MHRVHSFLHAVWHTFVDGLLAFGAFHGSIPFAEIAALFGTGLRPAKTDEQEIADLVRKSPYGSADVLLTPAERDAWNQLINRL
ncbi:hypothetical protein AB0L85_10395 [Streptomyces sp. NPDC052051]|uniref:hypothetical protein n=1 Tax=Streptomyces sp. NPDC052051 TaxID=3154649 RepID=UPI00341AC6CC